MARIPTADPTPGSLPAPNVNAGIALIDVSGKSHGAEALSNLSDAVGGAVKVGVKARQDDEDYETQKRFIEFDLAQERKLEEAKAKAPADPTGFSLNYRKSYDADAEAFFGATPERSREKVGIQLQERGARYETNALRFELNGVEKYNMQDLESELLKIDQSTMSNPDPSRVRENVGRSLSLIASSRIPNERKQAVMREQAERIEQTAVRSRIERGDSPEEILRDLRNIPKNTDGGRTGSGPTESGITFLKRSEGFAEEAKWDIRQFSVGYGSKGVKGERLTEKEADERLRREAAEVGTWLDDNIKAPLTDTQRDGLISFGYNLGTDDLDKLKDDINSQNWERVASRMRTFNKADGKVWDGLTTRREEEAAMVLHGAGTAPLDGVEVSELGPAAEAAVPVKDEGEPLYRYLTPSSRMLLMNVVRERGRADVISRLKDDVSRLRREGATERDSEGRTTLDRARSFLTPGQFEVATRAWNEAKFEHEAISPLKDLREDDFPAHAERMMPKEGPEYAERDKAFRKMQLEWTKVRTMRKKDPALAMADSGEVQEVAKAIREGKADSSLAAPEAWGLMFDARIKAQNARGIAPFEQRIITKSEATSLLGVGDARNVPDRKMLKELYDKAMNTAVLRYGPKYAVRAFEEAVLMSGGNADTRRIALAAARRLKAGQPLPAKDEEKLRNLDQIEGSERMTADPEPPAAGPEPDMSAFDTKDDTKLADGEGPSPEMIERFKAEAPSAERDRWFDSIYGDGAAKKHLYKVDQPVKPGEKKEAE